MNRRVNAGQAAKWITLFLLMFLFTGCPWETEAEGSEGEQPALLELESFLTNISDPAGERYCKLTVKLAVLPRSRADEIADDPLLTAQIRDQVLNLLASKTFHELTNTKNKEAFREQIRTGINELIGEGEVREVLFSEFVVQ